MSDIGTAKTVPDAGVARTRSLPPTERIPVKWWLALLGLALGGGAGGNVVARYTVQDPCTAEVREIRETQRKADVERALNAAAIQTLARGLEDLKRGQGEIQRDMNVMSDSVSRIEGWILGKREGNQ